MDGVMLELKVALAVTTTHAERPHVGYSTLAGASSTHRHSALETCTRCEHEAAFAALLSGGG